MQSFRCFDDRIRFGSSLPKETQTIIRLKRENRSDFCLNIDKSVKLWYNNGQIEYNIMKTKVFI